MEEGTLIATRRVPPNNFFIDSTGENVGLYYNTAKRHKRRVARNFT